MNASSPLTRDSSGDAVAEQQQQRASRLGEQQPLTPDNIPFDLSASFADPLPDSHQSPWATFYAGAYLLPWSQSVCLHTKRRLARGPVSTLSPTPDCSWTGDRQVRASLVQLDGRVAGWTWLLFWKPSTSRPLQPEPDFQRRSGRIALYSGSIRSNTGETERDLPHLLNDLITPRSTFIRTCHSPPLLT